MTPASSATSASRTNPSKAQLNQSLKVQTQSQASLWWPKQVLFTPAALEVPWGQQIYQRIQALDLPIQELSQNRITGLRGEDERATYANAKQTLAVVTAPPSAMKLQPIPPSADWQFHLAEGCPAHCQYCYLASSLSGPPVIRVFANLPQILENTANYVQPDAETSFEVSCYTDPLSLEHLTGSLGECIRYFGTRPQATLRWVSKFDNVEPLLNIDHNGRTRCRVSVNANPVSHYFEGGTAAVPDRLQAIRRLALPRQQGSGGYKVGLVIAPIMSFDGWEESYNQLFDQISETLNFECDLTFELISHRYTAKSKEVLNTWYPKSKLDMSEDNRTVKRNKFGGTKYVYDRDVTKSLKTFFKQQIAERFPQAELLYWT